MPQRVSVIVHDPFQDQADAPWLRSTALRLLRLLKASGGLEVVVTGDQVIAELNQAYLGEEGTTDVLSFPARGAEVDDFVWPPGVAAPLGEVLLCLPQAQRQAQEQGHGLREEMAHLLVHGVLHLLGHDHVEEEDARQMREREEALLAQLLPDGRPVHSSNL
jgi:probable rRNA maturation factor